MGTWAMVWEMDTRESPGTEIITALSYQVERMLAEDQIRSAFR